MVIVAIAGGIGGAINGLFHVTMNAYVFHNLFSVAMMTYSPFVPFLIGCATALVIGLLLTYFWGCLLYTSDLLKIFVYGAPTERASEFFGKYQFFVVMPSSTGAQTHFVLCFSPCRIPVNRSTR